MNTLPLRTIVGNAASGNSSNQSPRIWRKNCQVKKMLRETGPSSTSLRPPRLLQIILRPHDAGCDKSRPPCCQAWSPANRNCRRPRRSSFERPPFGPTEIGPWQSPIEGMGPRRRRSLHSRLQSRRQIDSGGSRLTLSRTGNTGMSTSEVPTLSHLSPDRSVRRLGL